MEKILEHWHVCVFFLCVRVCSERMFVTTHEEQRQESREGAGSWRGGGAVDRGRRTIRRAVNWTICTVPISTSQGDADTEALFGSVVQV